MVRVDLTSIDSEDFPLRIDWDWGNDAVGVRWTHARRGGGSLDLRANFSRYGTGLTFPDFADTEFDSRIQQAQLRADLDMRPNSRWAVQVGTSAEKLSYANRFSTGTSTSFCARSPLRTVSLAAISRSLGFGAPQPA